MDDAGSATPDLLDAIVERGGEVESAREYRPTFDEIFAELVRRDREARGEPTDAEAVGLMKGLIAVPVRLLAFLGKELVETIRRPGALVSLVLGPFLIMAIFGLGYDGYRNPLRTVVVAPPDTGPPAEPFGLRGHCGRRPAWSPR